MEHGVVDGHERKEYRATELQAQTLRQARARIRELFHELVGADE